MVFYHGPNPPTLGGWRRRRQAAAQIMAEAGLRGFYRGFAPVILRAFPANAATFAFKEQAAAGLDYVW